MEFKTSDNSYKPIKSHQNMDVKIVKKMSLAYAGYISKTFNSFPPF